MVTTISGNVVTIKSPCDTPVQSLKVHFSPIQNGSGDTSPSNVREIAGWTGLSVTQCGKNLWNENYEDITANNVVHYKPIYVGEGAFTMSTTATQYGSLSKYASLFFLSGASTTGADTNNNGVWAGQSRTVTAVDGYVTIGYRYKDYDDATDPTTNHTMIERGCVATEYEQYNDTVIQVDWTSEAGTVYGGYLDLISGELVQTYYGMYVNRNTITSMAIDESNNDYTQAYFVNSTNSIPKFKAYTGLSNRFKCLKNSTPVVNGFINFGSNMYFMIPSSELATKDVAGILDWFDSNPTFYVAELSSPVVHQLSPQTLSILRGHNNIFSNANGECEVTYDHMDTLDILSARKTVMLAMDAADSDLPLGYKRMDFVRTTGRYAWIDTGVSGDDETLVIDTTFNVLEANANYDPIFANYRDESNYYCWRIILPTTSTVKNRLYVCPGNRSAGSSITVYPIGTNDDDLILNHKVNIRIEYGKISTMCDGIANTYNATGQSKTANNRPITIGKPYPAASEMSNTSKIRIYEFKIWSNGQMVRNYIPCVKTSNGRAGLYDTVNHTFNPSAGSVDFVAGND